LSKASEWTSVAFPKELVEAVRDFIEELKYWPSVTSFCREATLEKIKRERRLMKETRGNEDVDTGKEG